jgi:NADP-dependent 3-hydroxy acid dehydrogenase YdfG
LGGIAKFDAGSAEVLESIIETNVQGLIRLTHVVLRGMLSRRAACRSQSQAAKQVFEAAVEVRECQ